MSVSVQCQCGKSYLLKDEFAGRAVACPDCGAQMQVPMRAPGDPSFAHDKFLLRQKALAISEKYTVSDEAGREILFIVRPRHMFRNLLALMSGFVAGGLFAAGWILAASAVFEEPVLSTVVAVGAVVAVIAVVAVAVILSKKRHVEFHRDSSRTELLLKVFQDRKVQLLTVTYTIADGSGAVIGLLRKNTLSNVFRRKWHCLDPQGQLLFSALEDSLILSLLRRVLGTFFGLLRVNFIFVLPGSDAVVGEFNRKFTILDRYAIDLSADPARRIDRRLALATGVMLDTGERR